MESPGISSNVPPQLWIPRTSKEHDRSLEVVSKTSGKKLLVNPYKVTCECEKFKNNHSLYEVHDIRRLCKHLCKIFCSVIDISPLDKFKAALLRNAQGVKSNLLFLIDKEKPDSPESVLILFDKDHEWWEIYAYNGGGNLQCYGFNILSNKWSHNQQPLTAEDLSRAVENILASQRYGVDEFLLKVRELVKQVNTSSDLRNLEKRLERAEKRYTPYSTEAQDRKYEILSRAWEVARDKV